jgi:hypothetical protein
LELGWPAARMCGCGPSTAVVRVRQPVCQSPCGTLTIAGAVVPRFRSAVSPCPRAERRRACVCLRTGVAVARPIFWTAIE